MQWKFGRCQGKMLSKEHKDLLQSFVNMQLICWSMVFGGSGVIGVPWNRRI